MAWSKTPAPEGHVTPHEATLHLMDLGLTWSEEGTWTLIRKAAKSGKIPHTPVKHQSTTWYYVKFEDVLKWWVYRPTTP